MRKIFIYVAIACIIGPTLEAAVLPSVGSIVSLGEINGLEIEAVVQSPSSQKTPLQTVCLFEYTEDDIYKSPPALPKELNGMVHVDEALKGLITDLRKSNQFKGKLLETLLIIPPPGTIAAEKLLLIGLGDRNNFNADIMYLVGMTGMREALRLGVVNYAHASDLKDAGIDSPTAEVAGNVIRGALDAHRTQRYLKEKQAGEPLTVTKVSLLTGPAYFEDSQKGVRSVINNLQLSLQVNKQ